MPARTRLVMDLAIGLAMTGMVGMVVKAVTAMTVVTTIAFRLETSGGRRARTNGKRDDSDERGFL